LSDAKKSGSRDISELKQRLGLKKGAAAASQSGSTPRVGGGGSGGVVPPPGISLPPPPGLAPPQPVIPNAADDPFGAMNAMAAVGAVQRAPEIVIVNDGKPVENVGASSSGARIARIAIPAGIALIVGITVGKIGASNGAYNKGLEDTKAYILGNKNQASSVAEIKKALSDIDTFLDEAKTKKSFRPDTATDKQLQAMVEKLEVKEDVVFMAKENELDPKTSRDVLAFYAGVIQLKAMVDQHVKAATSDDQAFATAVTKAKEGTLSESDNAALAGQYRYAVYVQAPTETDKVDFGAKLVELGPPVCNGKVSTSGKCGDGEAPSKFTYRTEPSLTWSQADLAMGGADAIPTNKLVMFLPGGVRDSLVKGADGVASEAMYTKRLRAIYELIHGKPTPDGKTAGGLLDDGNKLEQKLQLIISKGGRFSFFM
jgi:hypothetical protein